MSGGVTVSDGAIWLAAGLAMLVGEVLAPGVFLMWLGLAAIGAGVPTLAANLPFAWQAGVFAVLAVLLCLVGAAIGRVRRATSVNAQHSGLVGRIAVVLEAHGPHGRVRLGDSDWAARPDGPAPMPPQGAAVEVTAVAGTTLLVRGRPT